MKTLIIGWIILTFLLSELNQGLIITGCFTLLGVMLTWGLSRLTKILDSIKSFHKVLDGQQTLVVELAKKAGVTTGMEKQKEESITQNEKNIAAAHAEGEIEGRARLRDEQNPDSDTKPL